MAFRFDQLPVDLCRHVICTWIGKGPRFEDKDDPHKHKLIALSSLDCAYCNYELRGLYLQWICNMKLTIPFRSWRIVHILLHWLKTRALQVHHVHFDVYQREMSFQGVTARLILCLRRSYRRLFFNTQHFTINSSYLFLDPNHELVQVLSYMPSLTSVDLACSCKMEQVTRFVKALPNLQKFLRHLRVERLTITSLELPDDVWWKYLPYLTKLEITINELPCPNLLQRLCAALPALEDLSIDFGDYLHEEEGLMSLPKVHTLSVHSVYDATIMDKILRGCPSLRSLNVHDCALSVATMEWLVTTVLPTLHHVEYSGHLFIPYDECMLYLTLTAPSGLHLSSSILSERISNRTTLLVDLPITPILQVLHYLIVDCATTAAHLSKADVHLTLKPQRPEFSPFSTFWARGSENGLYNLTQLSFTDESDFTGREWAIILAYPNLRRLEFQHGDSEEHYVNVEEGLKWCAAVGAQSNVTCITFEGALGEHAAMASLLPKVFHKLQALKLLKTTCTEADVLYFLLHCPQLETLLLGEHGLYESDERCTSPMTALDDIDSEMWEQIAAVSSCTDLTLSDLPMQSWPAVHRMLDSAMGAKLWRVTIVPLVADRSAWQALESSEEYSQLRSKCRLRIFWEQKARFRLMCETFPFK